MVAELDVSDLFFGNLVIGDLNRLTNISAKCIGVRSYRLSVNRNAIKRLVCCRLIAVFVGVSNTVDRDRLAVQRVVLFIVSKSFAMIGCSNSGYFALVVVGKRSFSADAINRLGKLPIGILSVGYCLVSNRVLGHIAVCILNACCNRSVCHCRGCVFGVSILSAISIGDIIIHSVE